MSHTHTLLVTLVQDQGVPNINSTIRSVTRAIEDHSAYVFGGIYWAPFKDVKVEPLDVLHEFVADVEAAGAAQVQDEWPDLYVTYAKIKALLGETSCPE